VAAGVAREDAASGERLSIAIDASTQVSARWLLPSGARACYVLAHGAGAGMEQPFLRAAATELAALGVATLRFQFPYAERGSRRPDPPRLCHATVRAAVAAAQQLAPELPLFAGGRSFGGRMTSQAQALAPLPAVRGLVFLGFPLHPAGQPAQERAEHLLQVQVPMLFVQGTQDALAERTLLEAVLVRLGARASVQWVAEADHSFHVPARSGLRDAPVRAALLAAAATWMAQHS
jgi:predicted alpha/beta-hydrolase family hydrolase